MLSIYHQQRRVEIIHFNNDNDEITNRDKYIYIAKRYMTIKNGLSIRTYNSPLPIVNLQLSKALTDTFYDPRASSLPVTPPPPPLPPHTPPTKHLLAPQGGVQFQTSRVNCKNVECFRPSPPFSPPLFSLHLIRVASSVGDCFNGRRP